MTLPLTQHELDDMHCNVPGCRHQDHGALFFHGRCHPTAPTQASYQRTRGVVEIICAECGLRVATVAVAP